MPGGMLSPFGFESTMQLQNMFDDMEMNACLGDRWYDEPPPPSDHPGLALILKTNRTRRPRDAGGYSLSEFINDTIVRCHASGGSPDTLLLSPGWDSGFRDWDLTVQHVSAGETEFGIPIDEFRIPFLGGIKAIEVPLLPSGMAFCLTSSGVQVRMVRDATWVSDVTPFGGSADDEGAWVAEYAVDVENETHHAWVDGVTSWSF